MPPQGGPVPELVSARLASTVCWGWPRPIPPVWAVRRSLQRLEVRSAVRYAVAVNGLTSQALTKMDVLDECEEIRICVGYRHQAKTFYDMPSQLSVLEQCEPMYELFEGWRQPTTGVTSYAQLPTKAKAYLKRIEELTQCPIDIVSTGPKRDEAVIVQNPFARYQTPRQKP